MIRVPLAFSVLAWAAAATFYIGGCQQRREIARPAATTTARHAPRPVPSQPTATRPASRPVPPEPQVSRKPRKPKRPAVTWTKFMDAFDRDADAMIDSRWTGGNRLEVHTRNVRKLFINLAELPEGAPRRPPWNLQIDEQGIEITGRRGRWLELTRSDSGAWQVTGPKPRRRR